MSLVKEFDNMCICLDLL